MESNLILTGDSLELCGDLPAESVHAVVTDPPYGLAFMGRDWDDFEPREYQAWCEEWAAEVKRVLKPGGHLVAFSGNRTHHRLFAGVEDAGFEIRDTLTWHYGSGFPKALDVSKAIDKAADVDREVVGTETVDTGMQGGEMHAGREQNVVEREKTVATSDAAREWDGWKTALKPATEFIVLARKPFEGTVAECVQAHGTAALNVDGCRVDTRERDQDRGAKTKVNTYGEIDVGAKDGAYPAELGRYPANVIFDTEAAAELDAKGPKRSTNGRDIGGGGDRESDFGMGDTVTRSYSDSGGPSRYFYTSKASRAERTMDGTIDNDHPTVKPIDLMEWLVKLVTAEGQTVLDPFAGTGTTCRAAKNLGRQFVGMEQQERYADIARVRCGLTAENPRNIRTDPQQAGINDF